MFQAKAGIKSNNEMSEGICVSFLDPKDNYNSLKSETTLIVVLG